MGLEPLKNYGGCQGGTELAHIDDDATVKACRTLPVELGSLAEDDLKEIWKSAARGEVRGNIETLPGSCSSCAEAPRCRGGCPGLGVDDGRDGSCPGPVEG